MARSKKKNLLARIKHKIHRGFVSMCRESKECLDEMAQNLKEGYAEVAETCMDGTFHVIKNVKAILPCFNGAAAAATAADINQGIPPPMQPKQQPDLKTKKMEAAYPAEPSSSHPSSYSQADNMPGKEGMSYKAQLLYTRFKRSIKVSDHSERFKNCSKDPPCFRLCGSVYCPYCYPAGTLENECRILHTMTYPLLRNPLGRRLKDEMVIGQLYNVHLYSKEKFDTTLEKLPSCDDIQKAILPPKSFWRSLFSSRKVEKRPCNCCYGNLPPSLWAMHDLLGTAEVSFQELRPNDTIRALTIFIDHTNRHSHHFRWWWRAVIDLHHTMMILWYIAANYHYKNESAQANEQCNKFARSIVDKLLPSARWRDWSFTPWVVNNISLRAQLFILRTSLDHVEQERLLWRLSRWSPPFEIKITLRMEYSIFDNYYLVPSMYGIYDNVYLNTKHAWSSAPVSSACFTWQVIIGLIREEGEKQSSRRRSSSSRRSTSSGDNDSSSNSSYSSSSSNNSSSTYSSYPHHTHVPKETEYAEEDKVDDPSTSLHAAFHYFGLPFKRASKKQIQKAYKRLSLKHHPDHGGSTQEMQKVNRHKETLDRWLEAERPITWNSN